MPTPVKPIITPSLIDYLDSMYPDVAPTLDTPIDKVRYNSGQVSVVRHLKRLLEEQSNNILEQKVLEKNV